MFEMQVLIYKMDSKVKKWHSVRRSDGFVYQFKTRRAAERMLSTCYPGLIHADETRVVQI